MQVHSLHYNGGFCLSAVDWSRQVVRVELADRSEIVLLALVRCLDRGISSICGQDFRCLALLLPVPFYCEIPIFSASQTFSGIQSCNKITECQGLYKKGIILMQSVRIGVGLISLLLFQRIFQIQSGKQTASWRRGI